MKFITPRRVFRRLAFDLDSTLAEPTWPSPSIGKPIALGVQALLYYYEQGYECIIFTSRPASHIPAIRLWLEEYGLSRCVYDIVCDKPLVDLIIDDRAVGFPDGLLVAEPHEREFWNKSHGCAVDEPHSHPPFSSGCETCGRIR